MTGRQTADSDVLLAAKLAHDAGQLLLGLRASAPRSELGKLGDRESNSLILGGLRSRRPGDAVLSEESADDPARLVADRVWIIDPLDGTREFSMGDRADWAVHIALWEREHGITVAAVGEPALGLVHTSAVSDAPLSAQSDSLRFLVSASRPPVWIDAVAAAVGAEVFSMGSAGAKTMAVLRGEYDAYLHDGGQWEWDSAAPVGVALAHGLHASRIDGSALQYNRPNPYLPDLLVCQRERAADILAAIDHLHPRGG